MDREILKEKKRELKENVKGKLFFMGLKHKLRFLIEVLKLVYADIKSPPFRSKDRPLS